MTRASQKRVALFLPNLGGGGAERVAANLLHMLPDVERHLVLMEPLVAYEYDATLHVLSGNPTGSGTFRERSAAMAKNLVALRALKRKLGPATWLSFTTWANVLNVATGSTGRVVVSSHSRESSNIQGRTAPLLRSLVRLTYPRADLVVTVSDSVKRDLVSSFGVPEAKIRTIYNTVDLSAAEALARAPLDAALGALFEHPTIVTAGTLREPKGQWHLIRAFARARKLKPEADVRLLVLGEGPLGRYLVSLARDLGLRTWAAWEGTARSELSGADVVFLGFTENPFSSFARAALFAFPSLWEGFGNVILEAMACGALVVSADCQAGPREIIAPESPGPRTLTAPEHASSGILMPVLDGQKRPAAAPLAPEEETWARTLASLVTDEATRQKFAPLARARARAFSIEAMTDAWRAALLG